jgi:hypothetical protein
MTRNSPAAFDALEWLLDTPVEDMLFLDKFEDDFRTPRTVQEILECLQWVPIPHFSTPYKAILKIKRCPDAPRKLANHIGKRRLQGVVKKQRREGGARFIINLSQ